MTAILLLETATDICSVGLLIDGQLAALEESGEKADHAALLTLQIEAVCQRVGISLPQLSALALSSGPGSYSSLRVGASVAKGICYSLDKPLIAVDTLGALAAAAVPANAHPDTLLLPMLDARRQEVWMAAYTLDGKQVFAAQSFIIEHNLFVSEWKKHLDDFIPERYVLAGNGVFKTEGVPFLEKAVRAEQKKCSAIFLSQEATKKFYNADFQDVAYFEPFYMKPPNITAPNKIL
jgi:tRNA threonylcarbamoyladenosine biosynthesis protein TsaB